MACGVFWRQINELDRAMKSMTRFGISPLAPSFMSLNSTRSRLLKQIGFKFPRSVNPILALLGLSPGSLTLFHDVEAGWMVAARKTPGSVPVYTYVGDDVAETLLTGKLDHALEDKLMAPDDYMGE